MNQIATQTDNLVKLTPEENLFIQYHMRGMSAKEAYMKSHDIDPRRKLESLTRSAATVKNRPHVQAAIQMIREAAIQMSGYELHDHIGELHRLRRISIEKGNMGAAVRAEELIGKASGFYTDRKEVTFKASADNLLDDLSKVFGVEFAQEAAKKLGVDYNSSSKLIEVN